MKHFHTSYGWQLRQFSFRYCHFVYFDTQAHLADSLFYRREIPVHFLKEYCHAEKPYTIIICKVAKRHAEAFCHALEELPAKMQLFGHADYPQFCKAEAAHLHLSE